MTSNLLGEISSIEHRIFERFIINHKDTTNGIFPRSM